MLPEGVKGQGSPMQPGKTAQQQGQQRSSPRIDQGQQGQQGQGHIRLIPTVKHSRSLSKPSMGQKKQVPRLSPSSATAVPGQRSPATVSPRFAQKRAPGTPKTQANAPTLSPPLVTIAKPDAQKQSAEPASAANTALEKSEPTIATPPQQPPQSPSSSSATEVVAETVNIEEKSAVKAEETTNNVNTEKTEEEKKKAKDEESTKPTETPLTSSPRDTPAPTLEVESSPAQKPASSDSGEQNVTAGTAAAAEPPQQQPPPSQQQQQQQSPQSQPTATAEHVGDDGVIQYRPEKGVARSKRMSLPLSSSAPNDEKQKRKALMRCRLHTKSTLSQVLSNSVTPGSSALQDPAVGEEGSPEGSLSTSVSSSGADGGRIVEIEEEELECLYDIEQSLTGFITDPDSTDDTNDPPVCSLAPTVVAIISSALSLVDVTNMEYVKEFMSGLKVSLSANPQFNNIMALSPSQMRDIVKKKKNQYIYTYM